MKGIGPVLVMAILVTACSAAPASSPRASFVPPASSPALPNTPAPSPAASATSAPTIAPTPTASPTPTPIPTATPLPPITAEQLAAACNGTPVPGAAPYAGTIHPLVVLGKNGLPEWTVDGIGQKYSYTYAINNRWFNGSWDGPIQLVVCPSDPQTQKLSSCGSYTRSDGVVGQVIPYRYFVIVKVIIARTGKLLQSKTFYGGKAPDCADQVQLPATDNPPWKIYSDPMDTQSNGPVALYATAVSTQKVK